MVCRDRDTDDTICLAHNTEEIQPPGTGKPPLEINPLPLVSTMARISDTLLRRPSAHHYYRQASRHWQRSLAVEYILIALFVGFTACNVMFVLGTKVS